MDILLIKPGSQKDLYQNLSKDTTGLEPPVWASMISGYLQQNFSVNIIDEEVDGEKKILDTIKKEKPNLISIIVYGTNPSASTMNMTGVRRLLQNINPYKDNSQTILVGLHPSALPKKTIMEEPVDMVCQGEGFLTLESILSNNSKADTPGLWYKESNYIKHTPVARLMDLDSLPMPAWNLINMNKYRCHNWHNNFNNTNRSPYGAIYTSLGCPFNCSFCNINTLFGQRGIRYKPLNLVFKEIEYLNTEYKVKNLRILDEMFDLNKKRLEEFCDYLIKENMDLNIWTYTRVDTIHKDLLSKMKKAGINWVCPGFESGSEGIRKISNKGSFTNQNMKDFTTMIHNADINIIGNFMFGLPEDTKETMQDTLNLAEELNCEMINFYCTMAYPGSELYKENNQSWESYSQLGYKSHPLSNKYLQSAEVLKFRDYAFNHYFNRKEYQDMILEKFGDRALTNIKELLKIKLKRKLYE